MKPRCEDCKFWEVEGDTEDKIGFCRKNAPHPFNCDDYIDAHEQISIWPSTAGEDWCGEFVSKDATVAKVSTENITGGAKNNKLLNIWTVCEKYKLPARWVKQQTKAGILPCLKIGKRLFFCPDAVEDALLKLAMPSPIIEKLELSTRAYEILKSSGIHTVEQLTQKSERDLLKTKSFGKTCLREVKRKLDGMGLALKPNHPQ